MSLSQQQDTSDYHSSPSHAQGLNPGARTLALEMTGVETPVDSGRPTAVSSVLILFLSVSPLPRLDNTLDILFSSWARI